MSSITEEHLVELIKSIHNVQGLDQDFIENTHARLSLLEDKVNEILQLLRLRLN